MSLDLPPLNIRQSPIVWAIVVSVVVHGMALGWLPGLQHQAQSLMPQPLRILLPVPLKAPLDEPPVPNRISPPATPALPPEARQVASRAPVRDEPPPVLARSVQETVADVPVVLRMPDTLPLVSQEPVATAAPPAAAPDPAALAAYGLHVAGAVAVHQRYPRLAQMRQWQGTTLLQLELTAGGQLQSVRVVSSSGHEILDQQAVAMVRAASPLPPLPADLAGRSLTIDVPVVFRLAS